MVKCLLKLGQDLFFYGHPSRHRVTTKTRQQAGIASSNTVQHIANMQTGY